MLRYDVLLYLDLQKCLVFLLQFFCCFRVEIRNELANGCKLTNNQIRGWMLSEFRYLVAPPHYIGHTTGQNSQRTNLCMDIQNTKSIKLGIFNFGGIPAMSIPRTRSNASSIGWSSEYCPEIEKFRQIVHLLFIYKLKEVHRRENSLNLHWKLMAPSTISSCWDLL